jgi:cytochrome c553
VYNLPPFAPWDDPMFRATATAILILALLPLAANAADPAAAAGPGNAEAGATKAVVCQACHGQGGNSVNPEWPNLAGQNASYISEQLHLFRGQQRNNPIMYPMAVALTDQDIADLAAYFSAQTPAGGEADPTYWKAGDALYRGGDRKRNIPACKACHGPVGRGNPGSGYPALQAQHSVYTVNQLTHYASEERYVDPSGAKQRSRNSAVMTAIAKRLTPDDMRDLASYIQGMR